MFDGELELFHLEAMDELEVGMYGILEPREDLRTREDKHVAPQDLDLDYGAGRRFRRSRRPHRSRQGLLRQTAGARPSGRPLVALAFECQMFDEIPMQAHDVFMDRVITEAAVYEGIGRTII